MQIKLVFINLQIKVSKTIQLYQSNIQLETVLYDTSRDASTEVKALKTEAKLLYPIRLQIPRLLARLPHCAARDCGAAIDSTLKD